MSQRLSVNFRQVDPFNGPTSPHWTESNPVYFSCFSFDGTFFPCIVSLLLILGFGGFDAHAVLKPFPELITLVVSNDLLLDLTMI